MTWTRDTAISETSLCVQKRVVSTFGTLIRYAEVATISKENNICAACMKGIEKPGIMYRNCKQGLLVSLEGILVKRHSAAAKVQSLLLASIYMTSGNRC